MVDAFQDITIPFQMSLVEFFTMVKEHLTEDGVIVDDKMSVMFSGMRVFDNLIQDEMGYYKDIYYNEKENFATLLR
jgi:hypothetical protein